MTDGVNQNQSEIQKSTPANQGNLKSLRTFQGDIADHLSSTKGSMTTVVIAEQKRKLERPEFQTPETTVKEIKNRLFIVVGSILLVVGMIAVAGVYFYTARDQEIKVTKNSTIISFTQEKIMPIASSSRSTFSTDLINERFTLQMPLNSVMYLNTVGTDKKPEKIENFIKLIAPTIPSELARSLENKYMIGIYSYEVNEPFILLKQNDFGLSYSGMHKWENTMISDLGSIFGISQNASSTYTFEDTALKNKDLRVVKNENRKTILLYTFLDKETILITTTEDIFSAILGKYITNQISR